MGRLLLFLVAASVLATRAMTLSQGLDARSTGTALQQDHLSDVVAQRLSATGLAEASQRLRTLTALPTAFALTGEMMGGTYNVAVAPLPPDRVVVTSTGRLDGTGRAGARHERVAVFQLKATGGGPSVAPFLAQALTLERTLTMNGAQRVTSADPTANANVHVNDGSSLNLSWNAGIQGFYRSPTPVPQTWMFDLLRSSFKPNSNPQGLDVWQTADRVDIPVIDAEAILQKVGMQKTPAFRWTPGQALAGRSAVYSTTNVQNVNGVIDFSSVSTADRPATWVILGDFNPNGSLEVRGHVNIVASGNVNVNGSIRTGAASTLSLYSARDISLNGSTDITGSVMNGGPWGGNLQLSGNTVIRGPVATRGTVNFNGNARIVYTPLAAAMTAPLFQGGTAGGGAPRFVAVSVRG